MIIHHTFVVKRPRQEVFDYFANVENVPQWADNITLEEFTTGGGPQLGAGFREHARLYSLPLKSDVFKCYTNIDACLNLRDDLG